MKVAIVTGSNSGLGLEVCRLLGLKEEYTTIYLAVRSEEKGTNAVNLLKEFGVPEEKLKVFVVDVSSIASTKEATDKFMEDNPEIKIDSLILNAGRVGGPKLEKTTEDYNVIYAASLFGHHIMTTKLVNNGFMGEHSSIILVGSESSRGKIPLMPLFDTNIEKLALKKFDGDLTLTMMSMVKGEQKYDKMGNYADTKKFSNWWAGAYAKHLKEQNLNITVLCVSPGGTRDTNVMDKMSWFNRKLMMPAFLKLLNKLGHFHSLEVGAQRYVDALDLDESSSGKFYASPEGKLTGEMQDNTVLYPIFGNEELQKATFETLVTITG